MGHAERLSNAFWRIVLSLRRKVYRNMPCIFCKIVAREAPAKIVFQNDRVTAFRDLNPRAPTHILIVPNTHVESVFARNRVLFEAREISQRKGGDAVVKYQVTIEPSVSLEALTDELLRGGKAGLKAVEWETAKKRD